MLGAEVLEIGYLLKDFGTAAMQKKRAWCVKKYAFENLNGNKVCSVIKADNLPSIKVAESLGVSKEDEFIAQYYNGKMLHYLYCIRK